MRIFRNLRFVLFKDRSFFWPYMYICTRKTVYWLPLLPVLVPMFVIGLIGAVLTWIGDFLYDTVVDATGGAVKWCLKKSKFWDFNERTDEKFDDLLRSALEKHLPK